VPACEPIGTVGEIQQSFAHFPETLLFGAIVRQVHLSGALHREAPQLSAIESIVHRSLL
jgi:hypothetical protein